MGAPWTSITPSSQKFSLILSGQKVGISKRREGCAIYLYNLQLTLYLGAPMTCYNTQHSKNHEKARQKHSIAPNIQKFTGCYSHPPLSLVTDRNLPSIRYKDPNFLDFFLKASRYKVQWSVESRKTNFKNFQANF